MVMFFNANNFPEKTVNVMTTYKKLRFEFITEKVVLEEHSSGYDRN